MTPEENNNRLECLAVVKDIGHDLMTQILESEICLDLLKRQNNQAAIQKTAFLVKERRIILAGIKRVEKMLMQESLTMDQRFSLMDEIIGIKTALTNLETGAGQ